MQSLKTEEWAGVLKTRGQPARFFETLGSFPHPSLRGRSRSRRCAEHFTQRGSARNIVVVRNPIPTGSFPLISSSTAAPVHQLSMPVLSHVQPVKQTHGRYAASAAALSMPPLAMTGRAAITPAR